MNPSGLFGNIKISKGEFEITEGVMKKSLQNGYIFLADESNIAPNEMFNIL